MVPVVGLGKIENGNDGVLGNWVIEVVESIVKLSK
jgi:hypothetical protein